MKGKSLLCVVRCDKNCRAHDFLSQKKLRKLALHIAPRGIFYGGALQTLFLGITSAVCGNWKKQKSHVAMIKISCVRWLYNLSRSNALCLEYDRYFATFTVFKCFHENLAL